jgi:hypothetical protein
MATQPESSWGQRTPDFSQQALSAIRALERRPVGVDGIMVEAGRNVVAGAWEVFIHTPYGNEQDKDFGGLEQNLANPWHGLNISIPIDQRHPKLSVSWMHPSDDVATVFDLVQLEARKLEYAPPTEDEVLRVLAEPASQREVLDRWINDVRAVSEAYNILS